MNIEYVVPRANMTVAEICNEIVKQLSNGIEVSPVYTVVHGDTIDESGIHVSYPGRAATISNVTIT